MQVKRDAASQGDEESCVSYSINRVPSTKNIDKVDDFVSTNFVPTSVFIIHLSKEMNMFLELDLTDVNNLVVVLSSNA